MQQFGLKRKKKQEDNCAQEGSYSIVWAQKQGRKKKKLRPKEAKRNSMGAKTGWKQEETPPKRRKKQQLAALKHIQFVNLQIVAIL